MIAQVTDRIQGMTLPAGIREAAAEVLLETMPADERRHTEAAIAFSFLALGLRDPALARVQRLHFTSMYELCARLAPPPSARRLHAIVDGLTVHVLAGHLTVAEMVAELGAYLDELFPPGS
ncbi:TetR family transcriptional regulator C-terminal domain-containing protein [Actinoplanes sp. CA-030573]|uniref:TetR family transcriptional regulator C-terminal domain-containing protein n=1 Tax=Actinoplanes sp. CA-030573 TaxID=3239898 RepID=UPI003D8DC8CC